MASTNPPSRQHIKCGYCGSHMRRDRLTQHTRDLHPGKSKKVEGEVQSRNIMDMFKSPSVPSSQLAAAATGNNLGLHIIDDGSGPSASGDSETDFGLIPDNARPEGHGKRKSTDDVEGHVEKKAKYDDGSEMNKQEETDNQGEITEMETDHINRSIPSDHIQPSHEITSDQAQDPPKTRESRSIETLSEKMESVLTALADIKLAVKEDKSKSTTTTESVSNKKDGGSYLNETDALKTLVQTAKSVARVKELAGMNVYEDKNLIMCDVCSATGSFQSRVGFGQFQYDFSLGVDFNKTNQPAAFVNLKKSIVKHISTPAHSHNVVTQEEESEQMLKQQAKEQSIGITLGKQAYRTLKYTRPFSDYEVDVKLLADAGVKVGNLNHSRKFASDLRPEFAEVIDSRTKEFIQTLLDATSHIPPLGIAADKLTTRRRTGQMYAAILFTPGMPSLLTPISLGVTSVTKHDGEGIAADIYGLCTSYGIDPDQIAGFGFDGQYFHLKVDKKLQEKFGLDESVSFVWDAAHVLQLADHDTRKENAWIDEISKDIASVLSKFSFGKTFEAAITRATQLGIDFKAPLWFSDTRFAAYAHSVFDNFASNYRVVRDVLGKVAATDSAQAKDADLLLGRIQTVDFVAKLLICVDLYSLLGKLSQKLQKVNYPIWKKAEDICTYLRELDEIIDKGTSAAFPTLVKYEEDLQKYTFKGHPLLIARRLRIPARQTRTRSRVELEDSEPEDSDNEHVSHDDKEERNVNYVKMLQKKVLM